MKKQVTFAGGRTQTVRRLHQDDALPRSTGMSESKMALKDASVNFSNGLKINRAPAARGEPHLQHVTTIQIPKTMTTAPFLKHAALTPAQKDYLYTIAASYSTAHVRNLITQHYMNVLHRCIRADPNPERDDLVVTSVTDESDKRRSEAPSKENPNDKIINRAKNPGKSFLPKIPNRRTRLSKSSEQRNMQKSATSPTVRRKNPIRARIKLLEEEQEEEEGLDDSLSECLSLLSLGEWDDDIISDL
ncbi:uncharacterized protein LOC119910561 [Micropterus salmoides]|nr:uncharacterized protein LOC119910561 [Micropterus salmoides]